MSNNTLDQLKYRYNTANIVEKIIYVNIAVFIISYVSKAISHLMKWPNFISKWFALPTMLDSFIYKPWTLFTYGFLHSGFLHIFFNLLLLYYIGQLFLDFFSKKQFLIYYFLGIIVGGIIFLFSYNFFPALIGQNTSIVGASAGVMAIVIGLATKTPEYAMHFRFLGAIKLKYIALVFILLDIVQMPMGNTGGHLAHLGGALIGFLLTKVFNDGKNIETILTPKKQKPLKTVYKNTTTTTVNKKTVDQKKIDTILDKISKSGYDSLSKAEKDYLFSAGKNN